jgi:coproporphyrinogen III oxidase-like Fe-S oxidoreductase/pyruvate-formate lyase-activating enzyme
MNPEPQSRKVHPSLPIFEVSAGDAAALYTPGNIAPVSRAEVEALIDIFNGTISSPPLLIATAAQIEERALAAETAWQELANRPFEPQCLTVYLSNHCHLGCVYCYAAGPDGERDFGWNDKLLPRVNPSAVEAAARVVAENCRRHGKPLHLVLHGGGEPTLHWGLLQQIVTVVKRVGAECGLTVWSYISTSGVLPEDRARWLAEHIDHISLSTDGPPEIQNTQRPLRDGRTTAEAVERTARVLRNCGAKFSVRCTITRNTVHRQVEILTDLSSRLGACEFVFEPAYRADQKTQWALNTAEDAARFVDHFLAAQHFADAMGCDLQTSGVRLDEIHGPYCNVLRDVLQVTPDGVAVSCFVCTDGTQEAFAEHRIGHWEMANDTFVLDMPRAQALRASAAAVPDRCLSCHNIYHCARECPDVCPTPVTSDPKAIGGFRCEVQRRLGQAWIIDALNSSSRPSQISPTPKEVDVAARCLTQIPASISAAAIAEQWLSAGQRDLTRPRHAPDPIWAMRGFDLTGADAWRELSGRVLEEMPSSPMSIYVHVPFCDRKCDFCDCYSLTVNTMDDPRVPRYVGTLHDEIRVWGRLPRLTQRPVTTIHFGGGTPTYLRAEDMRSMISSLKSHFNVGPSTELALESTSSQITPATLELFHQLGITRLHVGVQSLEDQIRQRTGRKEPAAVVEEKLRAALAMGMVVTVDVIYGLPGQTMAGLVETLTQLNSLGVHGFSLYRLNLTSHNQPFARKHALIERSLTELFFFFQIGEALLHSWNYRKTHFAHFSRPEDRYLYYRHTRRGEDLLALGPSADGVFGSLHYRHPELGDYVRGTDKRAPMLCGASRETANESRLQRAVASLMTASLQASVLQELGVNQLLDDWNSEGLIAFDKLDDAFVLSANGSWFINDMLEELAVASELVQPSENRLDRDRGYYVRTNCSDASAETLSSSTEANRH